MRPEAGCVLLATHFERLWYVRINVEKLGKIGNRESDRTVWGLLRFSALKLFAFFQLSTMPVTLFSS